MALNTFLNCFDHNKFAQVHPISSKFNLCTPTTFINFSAALTDECKDDQQNDRILSVCICGH